MRASLLICLAALIACRDDAATERAKPNPTVSARTAKPANTEPLKPDVDPWQVSADADDPPSLGERHRIADEACPAVKLPYFYRVEKDGKVSHILGTRHVGVPLGKFPPVVQQAISSAKLAVFEVAPNDHVNTASKRVSLPDALGPELWSRYQTLVGAETAQAVARGAPSTAMIAMMVMYEDIGAMLDMEIERKVLAARIPTRGLERGEFQDKLLDKLLDLRMLRAAIQHTKDRKELAQESRDDLAEYCSGTDDTPGMDEEMRADLMAAGYSKQEIDEIDEEMVFARNNDWIPKLEKIFAHGNAFVAVGADHLSGSRGVVALLQKRGYTLTRVTK